ATLIAISRHRPRNPTFFFAGDRHSHCAHSCCGACPRTEGGRRMVAEIDPPTPAEPRVLVRRTDYLRRHAVLTLPYLTPHKVANLVPNEVERRLARARPRSVPPYIKVEATPLCHLSCGGCWHRSKAYKKTLNNKMHLTVERIARIVDPIVRELVGVSLSYSG